MSGFSELLDRRCCESSSCCTTLTALVKLSGGLGSLLPGEVNPADVLFEFHFKGIVGVHVALIYTRHVFDFELKLPAPNLIVKEPKMGERAKTPLACNQEVISLWVLSHNHWLDESVSGN